MCSVCKASADQIMLWLLFWLCIFLCCNIQWCNTYKNMSSKYWRIEEVCISKLSTWQEHRLRRRSFLSNNNTKHFISQLSCLPECNSQWSWVVSDCWRYDCYLSQSKNIYFLDNRKLNVFLLRLCMLVSSPSVSLWPWRPISPQSSVSMQKNCGKHSDCDFLSCSVPIYRKNICLSLLIKIWILFSVLLFRCAASPSLSLLRSSLETWTGSSLQKGREDCKLIWTQLPSILCFAAPSQSRSFWTPTTTLPTTQVCLLSVYWISHTSVSLAIQWMFGTHS